jgi:glycosyltransferase involved in cell wall biosynthesis
VKILVLQDYLRSGGTERQSILLANAFAEAGHETTLLTFRPGGPLAGTIARAVRHRPLQRVDSKLDWFAPGLASVARAAKPAVAICMGRMANCYAGALQKICPTIATMRTGKSLPFLFRRSLLRVSHVVANSREARDTLVEQYHVEPEKITVIYNSLVFPPMIASPVPLGSPKRSGEGGSPRDTLRAQHGATPATLVLLCVAMFRPEKNQRELIEIAIGLPSTVDWQLWLAGDGPARVACERLVQARNLGERVKFLGFHRDPSALYAAADVAVHASWSESLSNFMIEAQAHGLPAVAYEAQGIRECFVPEKTGWAIAHDDRVSFVGAITRIASASPAERADIAVAAKSYARTTFDPARQVQAYLKLFERIASSRHQ